jgi:hypothetical protein
MDSGSEEERRRSVPRVVEAQAGQSGSREQPLERTVSGRYVSQRAARTGFAILDTFKVRKAPR